MDSLSRFCTVVLGYIVSIGLGIVIMMEGWGLEPQSWWWIIGGGVFLRFLSEFMIAISKSK